jgi:formylglycine-generating enzyme required for sulfatase activity
LYRPIPWAWLPVLLLSAGAGLLLPARGQAPAGKKYALLVGVRAYDHADLPDLKYTENDVEALAKLLRRKGAGFRSVRLLTTRRGKTRAADAPTAKNIRAALAALVARTTKHDTVLVALAGHGLQRQVGGKDESFFCPADARPSKPETLIGLRWLFTELKDSGAGVKLLLVDACRNDPASGRSLDVDALPRPPRGTAALFSCSSGQRAFETEKLRHGVFFHFVLEGLKGKARDEDGEVTWDLLAAYVKRQVNRQTPKLVGGGARQTPHEVKDLVGESPVLLAGLAPAPRPRPDSRVEVPKKKRGTKLRPRADTGVKRTDKGPPRAVKTVTNSLGMKLVLIRPGKFLMGSPATEEGRESGAEEQQHEVQISRPFYLGACEVTQKQYFDLMGTNPSEYSATGKGKDKVKGLDTRDFPVECVTWKDAVEFCSKLSARPEEWRAGRVYRLPTEAEWEYACRAGTTTAFAFGNDLSSTQANFNGNFPHGGAARGPNLGRTCPVGSYKPNAWGLFDMHGNVREWCSDHFHRFYYKESPKKDPPGPKEGDYRAVRGGDYSCGAQYHRSAFRWGGGENYAVSIYGFRVACTVSSGSR